MTLSCGRLWAGLIILAVLGACRDIPADRLYALHLDHAPTSADWERALPRTVTVRGGRPHEIETFVDIDADTVHTSTASCHHGATPPEPVAVDVRAFYTEEDLFLRLSWPDPTRDATMKQWRYDGEAWRNQGGLEDGFGLLWDANGRFPRFSCSYACHIDDFGVSGDSFHARNRMRLTRDGAWLDLWNWKARRTGHHGFADDRYLDTEGMHGDVPGELFQANSRLAQNGTGSAEGIFGPEDAPVYDARGQVADRGFKPPGATAPGYLTERPVGGRGDVAAFGRYADGRWTVVLRRALETGDPRDAVFVPGDRVGVAFGLSIMDHTLQQHYASSNEETLVLLPRERD